MPDIKQILNGQRREFVDLSWENYKATVAMNASTFVHGRKSLFQLKHAWDVGIKDTDAMLWGRCVHCLLFEPEEVEKRYRPWVGRRAGNDYVLFCHQAQVDGVEVIRAEGEYSLDTALTAAKGFLSNKRVQELIKAGQAEQSLLEVECGLQCKARLDWVSTSEHVLTDLKTAAEIRADLFGKHFFDYPYCYDMKLGTYRRWLQQLTGEQWPVEVIVLESQPPHDVAVLTVPDAVLDMGVDKSLEVLGQVATAIETDEWPGVQQGYTLAVPWWAIVEETEKFGG